MADADGAGPIRSGAAARPPRRFRFLRDFGWFALGAALYSLALAIFVSLNPREAWWPIVGPSVWCTPIFGLPYVVASFPRRGRLRRILFFVALLTMVHATANYMAFAHRLADYYVADIAEARRNDLEAGAWGGVTGAVLAFTTLYVLRLTPYTRWRLPVIMLGTVLLTALGAVGMALGLGLTDALNDPTHAVPPLILWLTCVHLPWQLLFGLFLAWLMPPIRKLPFRIRVESRHG